MTEPFKSDVPAVTSKACSKGQWSWRGTCCSRQPLPNPSSSHAAIMAGSCGSSPRRKFLQSTHARRRGTSSRLCDVTSESVAVCMCLTGRKVANSVRFNGGMVDGSCASTKASDFYFLVLLFLTPTVRHANIWGILRVRTPSAAKIGSVFFVQSTCRTTAISSKHGHTSAWCIAKVLEMRLYRPPR